METIIIIPAHLNSKRLKHKLLLPGPDNKPLLYHTWRRAKRSKANEVIIATGDTEIAETARKFNAKVIITNEQHNCGTDRIEEALQILQNHQHIQQFNTTIINLQGDEPEIRSKDINKLITEFQHLKYMSIGTLAVPFTDFHQYSLPQNVKVVFNKHGNAHYFSRSMIPWFSEWKNNQKPIAYKHIGIYAYTPRTLNKFANTKPSRLEELEKLEQLRAIENSWPITITTIKAPKGDSDWPLGINTNEDYKLWLERSCQK